MKMSNEEGFKRKSTRMAAIEAARKIKKNADANKSLSRDEKEKYQFYKAKIVALSTAITIGGRCGDNNSRRRRGRKRKTTDQVFDSTNYLSEAQVMHDLSKNIPKIFEADPSKCEDMPKKRRGRPPKSKSAKSPLMRSTNTKYKDPSTRCEKEVDYDVNLRRESYNSSLVNNEPTLATIFSGPKQLHVGNGNISYRESLMKFSKDLGPTAQKVALCMLQGQGLTYQARHQLETLFQSPESQPHPRFMDVNSTTGSIRHTITNQLTQPLISFGDSNTDAIANYKGKKIMVDDGKSNCKKWDVGDNLEFLLGKRKSSVKICNGLLDNQDFVHKNLGYGQAGNKSTINHIGSFLSNYNGNLNPNINKISGIEDVNGQKEVSWNVREVSPRNGVQNSCVYPSTHVPPFRNLSSSYLGFDGGVSSIPWVPPPSVNCPPPVQPPQNWCLPPLATKINPVLNDDFWNEQELQLALALNMQMKDDEESKVWSQNLWAPSEPNQFLQLEPHGPDRQQLQEQLLMPMAPHLLSHMAMLGANREQDPLLFGTQHNFGFQMGNHLLHIHHQVFDQFAGKEME